MTRHLGGFEIHEKIGKGAMATVYRGVQTSLSRTVVVKIIHPHLAEDPSLVTRFEREARAAAKLSHENIVQVIDCGRIDETSFIAMEYVQGMDLKRLLESEGKFPLEKSIRILRDTAKGLQHAHENGVVHRDIKPANLMLTPDDTIKIMDFGLARRIDDSRLTQPGDVMGSPAYMSPEQAEGLDAGKQSDIFSLGVVGYELLSGHRPFRATELLQLLNQIRTQPPDPLPQDVPEDLAAIIRRMMEKEPGARFEETSDVHKALESVFERLRTPRTEPMSVTSASITAGAAVGLRRKTNRPMLGFTGDLDPGDQNHQQIAQDIVRAIGLAARYPELESLQVCLIQTEPKQPRQDLADYLLDVDLTSLWREHGRVNAIRR